MNATVILLGGLVTLLAAMVFVITHTLGKVRDRKQLEQWLRGNLIVMRVHVSRVSPDAVAVINSLERALVTMSPVNAEQLEHFLHALRRQREAKLIESVTALSGEKEKQ